MKTTERKIKNHQFWVKYFMLNCGLLASVSTANASYPSLAEALADTATPRSYTLTGDENVSLPLGTMGGTSATLTIDGSSNNYGINADNVAGINVNSGNTLILQNLGSVTISGEGNNVADYTIGSSVNGFLTTNNGGFVNNAGTLTIIDSVFNNNTASSGGAISNSGSSAHITEITNVTFYGNRIYNVGAGINNTSGASIGNINANFVNNIGEGPQIYGVGIHNYGGTIGNISGKFVGNIINSSYWALGVIYNANSSIQNISSDFMENSITGAYNYGGMLYNENASTGDIIGNFENNNIIGTSTYLTGAAISNTSYSSIGNITGNFKNNTVTGANATVSGLIGNQSSFIGNISGNFENNTISGKTLYGIIYNQNYSIQDITGDFKNNALSGTTIYGGIVNNSSATINKIEGVTFENNTATATDMAIGAAITNLGTISNGIINSKFLDNKAISASDASGAAIYTTKSLNIIADGSIGDGVSTFKGNYIKYGDTVENEAIYVSNASRTLTFDAKNGGVINMYDFISGVPGYTTNIIGDGTGTMNLYNDIRRSNVSVDNITLNIANKQIKTGTIAFGANTTLKLAVNSLADHGKVTANEITVADGAQLNATLANDLIKPNQSAIIQLLQADNTDFNNFTDSFDNNLYHFEKKGRNGAYIVSREGSAEDTSHEAGGSESEIQAAKAWVDDGNFKKGSTAAKVSDKLADLAQNDGKALNRALSAIALAKIPTSQLIMTNLADKLLRSIGNHLFSKTPKGVSSGDQSVTFGDATLWAKIYKGKNKLNGSFDTDNRGVIVGFDRQINTVYKFGFGVHYNKDDIDATNRKIDVSTLSGFVYGQYKPSQWYINGAFSYGRSDYDEQKYALNMDIRDNFAANIYSAQVLSGYDFKYLTPEIGARYYRIHRHGYKDNIEQSISGKNMDVLRGVFGVRSSYAFDIIKPNMYVGISYDFVRDADDAIVSLPNGSSYMVEGKHLKRLGYELNIGADVSLTDKATIGANYMGNYREKYQDHTGMLNFRYDF